MYYRPEADDSLLALKSGDMKSSKPKRRKGSRVGNENLVPNIFSDGAPQAKRSKKSQYELEMREGAEEDEGSDGKGEASLSDSRKSKNSDDDDDKFVKQSTFQSWFRYFIK